MVLQKVMPEGIRCPEAVSSKYGINLEFKNYDFSSVDYYEKHGAMLKVGKKNCLHMMPFLEQLMAGKGSRPHITLGFSFKI